MLGPTRRVRGEPGGEGGRDGGPGVAGETTAVQQLWRRRGIGRPERVDLRQIDRARPSRFGLLGLRASPQYQLP